MKTGPELLRGLQERAARAQPAEQVQDAEGWWLRHAPGCSWWIGTVLPHGDAGPDDLLRRVLGAEEFYAGHGSAASFQVCPPACSGDLDTLLARRGYRLNARVSMHTASSSTLLEHLQEQPTTGSFRVRLDDLPTRGWFDVWCAVRDHGGDSRTSDAEWNLLGRVEMPTTYASAFLGDDLVAVGRAVIDRGWAGVFSMATLPRARGRGAAMRVLNALARWAVANDAEHMYLQVEDDNLAALHLYGRTGFSELCTYHYRSAPHT